MTDKKRILIVDDDPEINSLLKELLQDDYQCLQAFSGIDALTYWSERAKRPIDLIILDLMLPDTSGEELLRIFRGSSNVAVIVLTAKGDTHTLVDVLDLGANDYIAKPFQTAELTARIRTQLRRLLNDEQVASEVLVSGDLQIDTQTHELQIDGEKLYLPLKEFDLLTYLVREQNKVVTKEELYTAVWGTMYLTDDNTINVHISRLRNKLREYLTNDPIETIWGVGFRFRPVSAHKKSQFRKA